MRGKSFLGEDTGEVIGVVIGVPVSKDLSSKEESELITDKRDLG